MIFIWWIFFIGGGFFSYIHLGVDWLRGVPLDLNITFESIVGIVIYFLTIFLIYKFVDSKYEIRRKNNV